MSDREPPDDDIYVGAMNQLIEQAIDYMGHDRRHDSELRTDPRRRDREFQEFQSGETEESKRAVTQLLLEAYVQVVGRQLVINMFQVSGSGQQLWTLERLCPSDGAAAGRTRVT